ncbi:MAG: transcription repressor NadR [Anaerolineae bacterium]
MDTQQRRSAIVECLKTAGAPMPGNTLARRFGVSRQVIVQDISVLRAAGYPILATAQGYLWAPQASRPRKVVAVRHTPEQTRDELERLVRAGVTVVDVIVEHPIYGEVTGQLQHRSLADVDAFMRQLEATGARLLSELTDGVHLHTLEADDPAALAEAERALREAGYLID